MSIEVTDADVEAVMNVLRVNCNCDLKNQDCQCWEWSEPSEIIAAAWRVMSEKQRQRPWHQRATELTELHGPYADFAAWHDWLDSKLKQETHGIICSVDEMDLESGSDIVFLYSVCCGLADQ